MDTAVIRRQTLLESAFRIRASIQQRAIVDEGAVRSVLHNLAPFYLSEGGLKVFEKTNAFYEGVLGNPIVRQQVLSASDSIATGYLAKSPFISGLLPAGQFYCDMYDPICRRFMPFLDLAEGRIDEFTFLRRDLPDYDFLHIFRGAVWEPKRNADEDLRLQFKGCVQDTDGWQAMCATLSAEMNISNVKLTSGVDERMTTMSDFVEGGSIAICMGNPIPETLWGNIPLLVLEGDYEYLNCLRDFILGVDEPLYLEDGLQRNIADVFRVNLLLRLISDNPSMTRGQIPEIMFDEIAKTMPHRPRHDSSRGLVEFSRRHWHVTVESALQDDLIEGVGSKMSITSAGGARIDRVLEQRSRFIERD